MKEIIELQIRAKENQLALIENRIRISREIEKKNMDATWEEMQEFLGHSYQSADEIEDRGEQLIDPELFVQMNASLVVTESRIKKDIDKLRIQLAKQNRS